VGVKNARNVTEILICHENVLYVKHAYNFAVGYGTSLLGFVTFC